MPTNAVGLSVRHIDGVCMWGSQHWIYRTTIKCVGIAAGVTAVVWGFSNQWSAPQQAWLPAAAFDAKMLWQCMQPCKHGASSSSEAAARGKVEASRGCWRVVVGAADVQGGDKHAEAAESSCGVAAMAASGVVESAARGGKRRRCGAKGRR